MIRATLLALSAAVLAGSAGAQTSNSQTPSQTPPPSAPYGGSGTGTPTVGTNASNGQPAPNPRVIQPRPDENPAAPSADRNGTNSAARTGQRTVGECRALSPTALKADPVCSRLMSGRSPR